MSSTTLGTATTRPGEAIRPGYGVTSTNAATAVTNHTPAHSRISWGAVFAGAAVAVASTVLLSLLGAALGTGSINTMTANASDVRSFSQGAGLWQIVNYVLSMALGGYVASRLSGTHSHLDGELHGLTTWAIALLFGAWLFAQALGGAIGMAGQGVSSVASRLADTAESMVPEVRGTSLVDRVRLGLSTGGDISAMTREQLEGEIALVIGNGLYGGNFNDADRTRLIALVAAEAGVTRDEATRRVVRMEAEIRNGIAQAERNARVAADNVAHGVAVASRALFAALTLGLLGALIGAWFGTRHKRALHPVVHHAEPVVHHETTRTVYETTHPAGVRVLDRH
jgi:hypothetical protein